VFATGAAQQPRLCPGIPCVKDRLSSSCGAFFGSNCRQDHDCQRDQDPDYWIQQALSTGNADISIELMRSLWRHQNGDGAEQALKLGGCPLSDGAVMHFALV
jgi:hypothetical protein